MTTNHGPGATASNCHIFSFYLAKIFYQVKTVGPRSLIRPWHPRRTTLVASPMDMLAFCVTPSGAAHHPSSPSPSSFYVIFSIPFVASMFSERASIVLRELTINTASSVTSVSPPSHRGWNLGGYLVAFTAWQVFGIEDRKSSTYKIRGTAAMHPTHARRRPGQTFFLLYFFGFPFCWSFWSWSFLPFLYGIKRLSFGRRPRTDSIHALARYFHIFSSALITIERTT